MHVSVLNIYGELECSLIKCTLCISMEVELLNFQTSFNTIVLFQTVKNTFN